MKNKNIVIGLVSIVLLLAVSVYLILKTQTDTFKKDLTNFAVKDTASISKIFLADRTGKKVVLERISVSEWKVNGKFEARPQAIKLLLQTIHNISVKATVPKPAFNNVVKRLATGAVKVEIYKHDELAKTYYVGGATQDSYGTYMIMENSTTPYIMWMQGFEGYLTPRYFTEENVWRNTALIHISPIEIASVKMEYPKNPEQSFELILKHDVANAKKIEFSVKAVKTGKEINFDTNAVKAYLLAFKNLDYEVVADLLGNKTKDSILALTPMHILTLKETNGKITVIKTYPRKGKPGQVDEKGKQMPYDLDRFWAFLNNSREALILQYFGYDKVFKPVTSFEK